MSHGCRALVISCIDYRLHHALHTWADKLYGPTGYDLVHLAGGGGALLQEDTKAAVLKQVEISNRLHGISEVVLVNHLDCGAYGGSAAFQNDEAAERARHAADLGQASDLITAQFPDLKIMKMLETLGGDVEMI